MPVIILVFPERRLTLCPDDTQGSSGAASASLQSAGAVVEAPRVQVLLQSMWPDLTQSLTARCVLRAATRCV